MFCLLMAIVGPVLFLMGPIGDPEHPQAESAQLEKPAAALVVRIAGSLIFFFGGGVLAMAAAQGGCKYESLTVDDLHLTIEHSFLGRTRRQRYKREYIGDLRVHEDVPEAVENDGFNPVNGGSLVFQYGAKTVFFGPEVERARADKLLAEILSVAPELSRPTPVLEMHDSPPADEDPASDLVSPICGRFVLEQSPGLIRITIPARSSGFSQWFMSAWLVLWVVGLVATLYFLVSAIASLSEKSSMFTDESNVPAIIAFLSLWLCLWIPGGLLALYSLVWTRWGRQIIEISESSIAVLNRSPLLRSRRLIDREKCGPISVRTTLGYFESHTTGNDRGDSPARGGWLECRSGLSKHHFGAGLTRREAEYLLVLLQRIDPSLVVVDPLAEAT